MKTIFNDYRRNRNALGQEEALIIVDLQNDFCNPKGSLYINGAEKISPCVLSLSSFFFNVFWTQDWHPKNHCSFKENGGMWPIHCVENEFGSEFLKDLYLFNTDIIIKKGTDPNVDSYSAFFDNEQKKQTELNNILQKRRIEKVMVTGVATDYCVKFTVLDSIKLGYETSIYLPGCTGVEANKGDIEKSIDEMEKAGATIIVN